MIYVVGIREGEMHYSVRDYVNMQILLSTVVAESLEELKVTLSRAGYKLLEVWK